MVIIIFVILEIYHIKMMTHPYFKRRIKTTSLDYLMRLINFKKWSIEYDFENQKY